MTTGLRVRRGALLPVCVAACCLAGLRHGRAEEPAEASSRWLPLHREHAAEYAIFVDAARRQKLTLVEEPVYLWTNPTRSGGQAGAVFVWTHEGRPLVVGSVFSQPDGTGRARNVIHEFHTLAAETLIVEPASAGWQPRGGLTMRRLEGAPPPKPTDRRRTFQLRQLARQFSAESTNPMDGQTFTLRLLPQPLYRYQSPVLRVTDGALFAFATNAGTDPEVLLLIEAIESESGPRWQYAIARFSDLNLEVQRNGTEVWSVRRGGDDVVLHNADHTYRLLVGRGTVAVDPAAIGK